MPTPGVLANDTDADGDTLSSILVANVSHGTLTLGANGSISYVPTAGYVGSDSFTYKANDGALDSNTVTVSLTVNSTALGVTDTTVADFGAGTTGGSTYVADTSGGEVILAPTVGAEFGGTSLPGGWSVKPVPWQTGGTATVGGGSLSVDAQMAATTATFGPGHSLDFVATFSGQPFQHVGFVANLDFDSPWAIVSTGSAGSGVLARTSDNPTGVSLGTGLLGSAHRYRIDWTATGFAFSVDGVLVTTLPFATSGPMLVGASDANSGTPLGVDWIRLSPYPASGAFTSRVIDAGGPAAWGTFDATLASPAGTGIAFEVRTGNSPTPDGTWSGFTSLASGADVPGSSRYIQYRATLSSTDSSVTPSLASVAIGYVAATNAAPVAVADAYSTPKNTTLTVAAPGVLGQRHRRRRRHPHLDPRRQRRPTAPSPWAPTARSATSRPRPTSVPTASPTRPTTGPSIRTPSRSRSPSTASTMRRSPSPTATRPPRTRPSPWPPPACSPTTPTPTATP